MTVIDTLLLEPSMEEICPRDDGGDGEQFAAKRQTSTVEHLSAG
jgi:hypothetical protein